MSAVNAGNCCASCGDALPDAAMWESGEVLCCWCGSAELCESEDADESAVN